MNNRIRYIRIILYVFGLFSCFVLQQIPNFIPTIMGAKPILLIPAVTLIAVFEGEITGVVFGLAAGLLMDISIGGTFGFYSVLLVVSGYFVGAFFENMLSTKFYTAMLAVLFVLSCVVLLQFMIFYLFKGYGSAGYVFRYKYLPRFLYTAVVSPVIYYCNKLVFVLVKEKE